MPLDLSALLPAAVLGLALAADAFAASLSQGVAAGRAELRTTALRAGVWFGGAQAIAALIGWLAGAAFAQSFEAYDHWIACAILSMLGAKLIHEGLTRNPDERAPLARGWAMAGLAVATSLDAVAAGVTLPTLGLPPLVSASVIGIVTAISCAIGVALGQRAGAKLGGGAEILGGLALIGIGVKVLFDHGALG